MKKFVWLFALLFACAVESAPPTDLPQAGGAAADFDVGAAVQELTLTDLFCPTFAELEERDGWLLPARLPENVSCPGRPSNRKLLSPECPTCPLIWVYPLNSDEHIGEIVAAAKRWNDYAGWTMVGVDTTPGRKIETVPTYGVVMNINYNFKTPSPDEGIVTGGNMYNWYRCYRDGIFISKEPYWINSPGNRNHTITHEIGHTLMHAASREVWHDSKLDSLMAAYRPRGQVIMYNDMKVYYEQIRSWVLSGRKTLPCALRKVGC